MKTFLQVAQEQQSNAVGSKATRRQHAWLLAKLAPIHDVDVAKLKAPDLFKLMQAEGSQFQTAQRMKMLVGRVLRYAYATDARKEPDFTPGLGRVLARKTPVESHAAVVDPAEVGALLRAIDALDDSVLGKKALRLAAHLFVRPGELRTMEWRELDFAKAQWVIPPQKTKKRRPHVVPLSSFVAGVLADEQTRAVSNFVFHGPAGCISHNRLRDGLARAGYGPEKHTPHGFRSTASTLLNELGQDPVVIELQMAHFKTDRVARIYNRETRLPERVALMEFWSGVLLRLQGVAPAAEGWE
jgi:integrase